MTDINTNKTAKPANFLIRAVAHLLDLSILQITLWYVFGELENNFDSIKLFLINIYAFNWSNSALFLIIYLTITCFIVFFYFFILELSPLRASLGKYIFGMQVIRQSARVVSLSNIVKRNLARFLCLTTFGLGYLFALFSRNRQGLHDLIGRTVVVAYPYPKYIRLILAVISCCIFIAVSWHLPLQETKLLNRHAPELLGVVNERLQSGAVGYLSYPAKTHEFKSAYARIDNWQGAEISGKRSKLTRIRVALFEEELSTEERQALNFENDFFKETYKSIGKRAVVVITISYPQDLINCDSTRIKHASISLNPAIIPHASLQTHSLVQRLDLEKVIYNSTFFANCLPNLSSGSILTLKFQHDLASFYETPDIFINLDLSTVINANAVASKVEVNNLPHAVALWSPFKEEIQLAFYQQNVDTSFLSKLQLLKNFLNSELPKPQVLATFKHSNKVQVFSRDQVSGYDIKFFKQEVGPLSFGGDLDILEVNKTAPELPDSLNGKMKNGERLIGRVSGIKRMQTKGGYYNFEWNLSFNARVLVID